jgi:hypothetical protein
MNAVVPIEFMTPDGVTRTIRATNGARRRIAKHFGELDVQKILAENGDGALSEIAYFMLFDANGNPPNISLEAFSESLPWGDGTALLALVLSAFSQGQTSPNEMEAQLKAVQELSQKIPTITGLESGPSADTALDSPTETSGTDSSPAKLTLLERPIESRSDDAQN